MNGDGPGKPKNVASWPEPSEESVPERRGQLHQILLETEQDGLDD